jgi:hypothetical protein
MHATCSRLQRIYLPFVWITRTSTVQQILLFRSFSLAAEGTVGFARTAADKQNVDDHEA